MNRLLLFVISLLLPLIASAEAVEINNLFYNINSSTYTAEFTYCLGTPYPTSVVIPSTINYNSQDYTVNAIGQNAFGYTPNLTSVTIPESVTIIGQGAFSGCTVLTSITIPNNVTTIGEHAFKGCSGLTSITLPNSVTTIGSAAFRECTGLTSITVGAGNTIYDSRDNCNAIIEKSTKKLIAGCKTTIIPNTVEMIDAGAFSGQTGLTSITIPESVTSITNNPFTECSGLSTITVASGNPKYYSCEGSNNYNAIIETSSKRLITGCKNTVIPNEVTSIGYQAFYGCTGLTSITIPDNVTSIGTGAFLDCSSLTSVTIPSNVTSIGIYAFGCSNLTSVTVKRSEPIFLNDDTFTNRTNATLYVPTGSKTAYEEANHWGDFSKIYMVCSGLTIEPIDAVTYDGTPQTPTITVKDGTTPLTKGDDYDVSYEDNIYAGTATVTVTGSKDYYGTKTANFAIDPKALADGMVTLSASSFTYNGSNQKPTITVKDGTTSLIENTDYTLTNAGGTAKGNYDITVTGKDNYSGTITKQFAINPKALTDAMVTLSASSFTYNGSNQKPTVTVKDGTTSLIENTDFTLTNAGGTDVGSYDVKVTGKGNYSGTITKQFAINPKALTDAMVTLSASSFTYNGGNQKPTVTVKDGTTTLIENTDYTLTNAGGTAVGSYDVKVEGKGNYSGTITKQFTITASSGGLTVTLSPTNYTYDGIAKTPAVTVKSGTTTLNASNDYTVSYSDNTNAGTATVSVTGKGNYNGSFGSATFTIDKAPLTITAQSYTIKQGEALPTFTATYSGFQNGETSTVLTKQPTISCSANADSELGDYDITVSGAQADNYDISYVNGKLTIAAGQYMIIYKVNGVIYKTISYDYGDAITPEPAPVREGFTFSGWSEIPATMPAKDVTVTGSFIINKYKLTYMVDDEVYKSMKVKYGAPITPEAEPVKEGYTFSGWSEIPERMPARNVVVYGTFTSATGFGETFMSVEEEDVYYDLHGLPVERPGKGIYIKNGQKVLIK